jgi:hypothetical protein
MENGFDEEFESADDESFEEVRLNNEKTQRGAFFLVYLLRNSYSSRNDHFL